LFNGGPFIDKHQHSVLTSRMRRHRCRPFCAAHE